MWLTGSILENVMAVMVFGGVLLLLARLAYGPAESDNRAATRK